MVNKVRKILQTKKVGHAGTLDPDAIGVLPVCVGKATRLVDYLMADKKIYRAILKFGYETDTQDESGQIVKKTKLPDLNQKDFSNYLKRFLGEIEQLPPMYSAIKTNGQPLYKLARAGKIIERQPRKIYIYNLKLLSFSCTEAFLEITCGKGTYIRTLCHDIGQAIGSSAYMSFLLRTRVGNFHINDSVTLDELQQNNPERFLINPVKCLVSIPHIVVNESDKRAVLHGNRLSLDKFSSEIKITEKNYLLLDQQKNLLAVAVIKDSYLQPKKVFG